MPAAHTHTQSEVQVEQHRSHETPLPQTILYRDRIGITTSNTNRRRHVRVERLHESHSLRGDTEPKQCLPQSLTSRMLCGGPQRRKTASITHARTHTWGGVMDSRCCAVLTQGSLGFQKSSRPAVNARSHCCQFETSPVCESKCTKLYIRVWVQVHETF